MKIVNVHYTGMQNIGDEICSPNKYFDIGPSARAQSPGEADAYVWGGGCVSQQAARFARSTKKPVILWGAGSTKRGSSETPRHPDYSVFALASTRDANPPAGAEWVPCPSCMHGAFNVIPEPTQKTVYYGHKLLSPMGDINNDCMDFESVIAYLASGEEIVTSSYHGMVWGTWLGRKVRVKPFGSKFYGWPYEWGQGHEHSLFEARVANLNYWKKVQECLRQFAS